MSRRTLMGWLALLLATATATAAVMAMAWAWRAWGRPQVEAITVQPAPLVRTLLFSARVATASRVDIGSTVTGRVHEVLVTEGTQVRQGQVLLRLESEELSAALGQARATAAQATARLAGLRQSGRAAAQAGVAQADSNVLAARAELQRTQSLVTRGFLSEARLDETRRALAVAQAQQAGAAAQRAANAEDGTDVAQATAQVALAQAAVAAAQARLQQAVLLAPADARVLVRAAEPGHIVQPGRALLSLALGGPVLLIGQVDERYLEQLQIGQAATVVADAYATQPFPARVQSISPLVDSQRGAVEIKLALPQTPPAFLREDMSLSVQVETGRRDRTLVVPTEALDGDAATNPASVRVVRVVRDGRVERQAVTLGLRTLDAVEVLEGLAAGDAVVVGSSPEPGHRVRLKARVATTASNSKGPKEDAGSAITNATRP